MAEEVAQIPSTIEDGEKTTATVEESMEIETEQSPQNPNGSDGGVGQNGNGKRSKEEEDNGVDDDATAKKQKVEKSVEEERLEELKDDNEGDGEGKEAEAKGEGEEKKSEPVSLGPKNFSSSVEMFDYLYAFLHYWPTDLPVNKYEHMVLLDLLKKGTVEPNKKIREGISAFVVRYHPVFKSRCYFLVRVDESVDDFSFRKCIDHILALPEEYKVKPDANKVLGGREGAGGRGGRGGGSGGRGGRGGRKGGWRGGRGRGGGGFRN